MEITPSPHLKEDDNSGEESNIDIGALISKFIRNWKWFVLSFVLSVLLGLFNLNFKRPQFEAITTIEIKNDASNGDPRMNGVFQQMGIMAGSKDKVADEMEIIKSKSLIAEVVKSLNLNIKYFSNKNYLSTFLDDKLGLSTEFYELERYDDPPLKITFLKSDSAVHNLTANFFIQINSEEDYTFIDQEKVIFKKHSFGEKIITNFGEIIITPIVNFGEVNLIGQKIEVSISPLKDIVDVYSYHLNIERKSEFSHILGISINDGTKQKAVDFLNELVKKYNERAVNLKEILTQSTKEFVNERIQTLEAELGIVDLETQRIKSQFGMSNAASQVGINMQNSAQLENEILIADNDLKQTEYLKSFIDNSGANDVLNLDLGGTDNTIAQQQAKYNELMQRKKELLKNSTEKNPTVAKLSSELKSLKDGIGVGLSNIYAQKAVTLTSLKDQYSIVRGRIYVAPKQENLVREKEREQGIKEDLFLLLLRKREETALTLGVHDPNARIIDYAESLPFPKSPKKKMALLIAGFIGLIIPAAAIYLKDSLDSKFHTREEVERQLGNIPIIGDIPKLETKGRYLIKKNDYSSIAEAFRILRTNLKFMLPKTKNDLGQVIFITSTIAHEGKSLVSTNLSAALAFADKKTILMGMDIRAPKLDAYLGARSTIGVTNYIINNEIKPEDIIVSAPEIENLDIMSSGDLAPNPAELLMHERVAELFKYARENYDYVIVDTAAFSMVTDTLIISGFADAFIYVLRSNYLDKRQLKYVRSLYRDKRLPNLSVLINGIDYSKGYGYGYGYGSEFEKSKKKWWKFG